jgi:hypothetical protein
MNSLGFFPGQPVVVSGERVRNMCLFPLFTAQRVCGRVWPSTGTPSHVIVLPADAAATVGVGETVAIVAAPRTIPAALSVTLHVAAPFSAPRGFTASASVQLHTRSVVVVRACTFPN